MSELWETAGSSNYDADEAATNTRDHVESEQDYVEDFSTIVAKNTQYYFPEFEKVEQNEKRRFNWAAFFFNGIFAYYRKSQEIFWYYYRWPIIIYAVIALGIAGTGCLAVKSEAGLMGWLAAAGLLSVAVNIYMLVTNIRFGKNFNRDYYQHCMTLVENSEITPRTTGTSVKNAVLYLIVVSFCAWIIGVISASLIGTAILGEVSDDVWDDYSSYQDAAPSDSLSDSAGASPDRTLSNFVGDYTYDASFNDPDGTDTDFCYSLQVLQTIDGINVSLEWRGGRIFGDVYISNSELTNGNTVNFYAENYQTDYDPGYHSLTYVPASQSPYGTDTIYVDGDTDMPFIRDSYAGNTYSDWGNSDSYILPTDTQYITAEDLYGMSKEQVSLARNEIYARYGYSFKSLSIRDYFLQQSWYHEDPSVNANTFGVNCLSDCERTNLETIQQYERGMGWK